MQHERPWNDPLHDIHQQPKGFGVLQQVKGVQPLRKGINPATWMLEVSTLNKEHELGVDFADIYRRSDLYRCATFLNLRRLYDLMWPKSLPPWHVAACVV